MSGTQNTPAKPAARAVEIYVKALEGQNGEHIELARGDIVLVVGPNNAGKTSFLTQLSNAILAKENLRGSFMFASLDVHIHAPPDKIADWLASYGPKVSTDPVSGVSYLIKGSGWNVGQVTAWLNAGILNNVYQFIATFLLAGNRTGLLQAQAKISINQSPANALQRILLDERLEAHLSRVVKKAFGSGVLLDRGYMPTTPLYFGEGEDLPGRADRLSPVYQGAVQSLPLVDSQGDGIKAFVGIMAELLTTNSYFVFIDEPELFLHPPQARLLGSNLAKELPKDTQLFLATHSGDFVRGLINAEHSRVRILRVQRRPGKPQISEIAREQVAELWKDPLLRVSNVLDGLFHERVFVCEGDTDCRFYSAVADAIANASAVARAPDCAFVHGGGKGKTPTIARALAAVNVTVGAIFDLDVLSDSITLSKTVEALGGEWESLRRDWELVVHAIEARRPEASASYVKGAIEPLLASVEGEIFPQDVQRKVTALMKSANPWSLVKQGGTSYLPPGNSRAAWQRLDTNLRALGIFLVPEGELEGFYRLCAKGSQWIEKALAEPLTTSPSLEAARKFVSDFMAIE